MIPSEQSDDSIAVEALREHRERPWLLLGVGLLSLGAIFALSEARFWPGSGNVWLAARSRRSAAVVAPGGAQRAAPRPTTGACARPAAAVPPPPVLGALLAATGLGRLLAVLDINDVDSPSRSRSAS